MKRLLVMALAGAALLAPGLKSSLAQDDVRTVTLMLPHPLGVGDSAWIELQLGPIGRREVSVTTASGEPLGTISPFGIQPGQDAGTYSLPVPSDAIRNNMLSLQLSIGEPGGSRAPTAQEVQEITVRIARGP